MAQHPNLTYLVGKVIKEADLKDSKLDLVFTDNTRIILSGGFDYATKRENIVFEYEE
jgi:hypothetical protein